MAMGKRIRPTSSNVTKINASRAAGFSRIERDAVMPGWPVASDGAILEQAERYVKIESRK